MPIKPATNTRSLIPRDAPPHGVPHCVYRCFEQVCVLRCGLSVHLPVATSPLQRLKGPRDSGFLLGHVMAVREIDAQVRLGILLTTLACSN